MAEGERCAMACRQKAPESAADVLKCLNLVQILRALGKADKATDQHLIKQS